MKIAILNYTGTVGKTTIAAHLLSPRMTDAEVFAVETINETAEGLGVSVESIRGDKFRDLFKKLLILDDAIIDVGASNIEDFLNGLLRFESSSIEIDLFLVPVTHGTKEQSETIKFVKTLNSIGVPQEKIHIIFNRVNADSEIEFLPIFNFSNREKLCLVHPDASIYENEVFDLASMKRMTIAAILDDENDYKALIKELGKDGDKKLLSHYSDMHAMKALAKTVSRNLDKVFQVVTGIA